MKKSLTKYCIFIGFSTIISLFSSYNMPNSMPKKPTKYPFFLPKLPYAYDALEPHIDTRTMKIHHDKHHQGYITKLNAALKEFPELQKMSLVKLITSLDQIPQPIRTAVRNNGGGHFCHSLFWKIMNPQGGGKPEGDLARAIERDFKNFEEFKKSFSQKANAVFGSGWTWLCITPEGTLRIISTPGHDVPMNQGLKPILIIDMWEHAYYLKHQNRRPEYINAWWKVINWPQVELYYKQLMPKQGQAHTL